MIATRVAALAAGALAALACLAPAAAQVQLGGDDRVIGAALEQDGYDSVRIVKRDFTIVRTHACKGDKKYLVKVSILGKITSSTQLGPCDLRPVRASFGPKQAERAMRDLGYDQVEVRSEGRRTVARGCLDGRREEVVFDRRGRERGRQRVGRCAPPGLDQAGIRDAMRNLGYRRIEVTDAELPRYVAQGCRDGDRFEVVLNRAGRVRDERRIGSCGRRRVSADDLRRAMGKAGYDRIEIVDARRAPFIAEGCRGADRMEVTIGRNGNVRRERRVGRCAVRVTEAGVRDLAVGEGLINIVVNPISGDRWRARGCRDDDVVYLTYSNFGEKQDESVRGKCRVSTALEMMRTLERRGATRTELQIEGCFKNSRYRWRFDRLGNRTGRERVPGNC